MAGTPVLEPLGAAVLTINTGSSSLKAALYQMGMEEELRRAIVVDRIGHSVGRFQVTDGQATILDGQAGTFSDHNVALEATLSWLNEHGHVNDLSVVGHRVVHGGMHYHAPQRITEGLLQTLDQLIPIDPEHLPQALSAMRTIDRRFPGMVQVACFDTAFHRTMPAVAQRYPLPRRFAEAGVIRYGFHGLSYQFIVEALRELDPQAAASRVIVAHLGNGASLAALRDGICVDTTMGFTPTGGLMMSTRSGDLDPSVPLFMQHSLGLSADEVAHLVNTQAGLLGVSETTADMRELLEREPDDPRAAEAIDLFCYQARKHLGALTAVLGGLDTLVFTGGIGEHAAPIRQRICQPLDFLGVRLDTDRNAAAAPVISVDGSPVTVRVISTNEDLIIARLTFQVLTGGTSDVHL